MTGSILPPIINVVVSIWYKTSFTLNHVKRIIIYSKQSSIVNCHYTQYLKMKINSLCIQIT